MKSTFRKAVFFITFLICCVQSHAQNQSEPVILSVTDAGAYSIVERSDWRRYDNGKYTGLVRNEVRASIVPLEKTSASAFYRGNFFVLQSTLRDMRHSAQAVDAIVPVSFEITRSGSIEIENERGYPMMRCFPSLPDNSVTRGMKWRAPGRRAIDPFNMGQAVVIPFTAEYEYRGTELYNGILVHRLFALYGFNYGSPVEPHPYVRVMGSHRVDILVRAEDGLTVFMRDELSDIYTMSDGSKIEFRGFTLTFNTSLVPLDRSREISRIEESLKIEPEKPEIDTPDLKVPDIDLTPVPEGIKLTIRNIRFIADSSLFLPSEIPRLDLIAQALKQIHGRTFLVEGHTASTGQPANEMQLSIERAISTINELVKRGISADRFIYKGWGGTRPIDDNATDAGRSANRRVEITILE